jgi:hypothetical protein
VDPDFELRFCRTRHPVETYAIRALANAQTVVYTADTGPSRPVTDFAWGANLLIAEASFQQSSKETADLHMSAQEAGQMAAQGREKRDDAFVRTFAEAIRRRYPAAPAGAEAPHCRACLPEGFVTFRRLTTNSYETSRLPQPPPPRQRSRTVSRTSRVRLTESLELTLKRPWSTPASNTEG